jgi:hypothetical protein
MSSVSRGHSAISLNEQSQQRIHSEILRWCAMGGGVAALTVGPALLAVIQPLFESTLSAFIEAAILGCLFAAASVPSIALAICATLHWRAIWQRCLLFAPAFGLQAAAFVWFWCRDEWKAEMWAMIFVAPLVLLSAATPAFFLRLWRGWTLVANRMPQIRRPASIASLLWTTGLWSLAAAFTRFGDSSAWSPDGTQREEICAMVVTLLLIPAAWVGLSITLLSRVALLPRLWRSLAVSLSIAASFVALTTGVIALLLYGVGFRVDDHVISSQELLVVAIGVASFCATAMAIGFSSSLALRLLGYRIVHRGTVRQATSSSNPPPSGPARV